MPASGSGPATCRNGRPRPRGERRRRPGTPTDFRIRPGLELARAEADELLVNEERDEFVFVKYL